MKTTFARRNSEGIESPADVYTWKDGSRMRKSFKRGDHVSWNSEAGRVRGVVLKKLTSDTPFKGYVHHATTAEPQYLIRSDKTDHVAMHKAGVLRLLKSGPSRKARKARKGRSG